ncbi:MAG: hypothetical protein U5L11_12335 [Arhodomonas sp.]|nr:hypothetical protein [Arhodomonas sp.]
MLHEERPFHCVSCGKAFATEGVIDRITSQLAEHWMFGDERSMRRLKMCEECRVRDLLAEEGGLERYR